FPGPNSHSGRRANVQHLFNLKTNLKCIAFSPDGCLLAVGGDRGLVQVWDATTGELVERLQGARYAVVNRLFFTGGGTGLVAHQSSHLLSWDLNQAEPVAVVCPISTWGPVALSPDGTRLVLTASPDGQDVEMLRFPGGQQEWEKSTWGGGSVTLQTFS